MTVMTIERSLKQAVLTAARVGVPTMNVKSLDVADQKVSPRIFIV